MKNIYNFQKGDVVWCWPDDSRVPVKGTFNGCNYVRLVNYRGGDYMFSYSVDKCFPTKNQCVQNKIDCVVEELSRNFET